MQIAGKVALVTGGASGLGLATVHTLVERGAKAVILDLPSSDGESVAKELGDDVRFVPGDVTDEDQVRQAAEAATELGGLHINVNCAGIGHPQKIMGREGPHPLEPFMRVLNVNLVGTFNAMRLAAEQMVKHDPEDGERGVIVNTASVAAFDGQIGQVAYSASKGGIVGMTLVVARDLASSFIRCCTIAPGLFDTPLLGRLPQENRDALGKMIPHPSRLGRPDEYAQMARAIVENPMMNGETIRLDGAIRMAPR